MHDRLIGRQREDKVCLLRSKLEIQQSLMLKPTGHTQNAALAGFRDSNLLAKKLNPLSDGEFVKECMDILVDNICPEKVHSLPIYRCLGEQ